MKNISENSATRGQGKGGIYRGDTTTHSQQNGWTGQTAKCVDGRRDWGPAVRVGVKLIWVQEGWWWCYRVHQGERFTLFSGVDNSAVVNRVVMSADLGQERRPLGAEVDDDDDEHNHAYHPQDDHHLGILPPVLILQLGSTGLELRGSSLQRIGPIIQL